MYTNACRCSVNVCFSEYCLGIRTSRKQTDKRITSTGSILLNIERMSQGFDGWSSSPRGGGTVSRDVQMIKFGRAFIIVSP